jgi:hypothetical protein
MTVLDLDALRTGAPGMTPDFGGCLAEAASVCLEDQQHSSGTRLTVDGDQNSAFELQWGTTTDQMRRCWADEQITTEHGAYGIATLLVHTIKGLVVAERSRKGTGFDFWLGTSADAAALFQDKARLEVSGIRNGSEALIAGRVREKAVQTTRSDGRLAAIIVVVEFGTPRSRMIERR